MSENGLENFTNVLTVLAAIGGVVAAWFGLFTWKAQGIWAADNELARRVLISLYRYRDSLYAVRHPAMSSSEMDPDPKATTPISGDNPRSIGTIRAYVRRWERHSFVQNELDALLIECDAVWGKRLSEFVRPLKSLQHELYAFVSLYLDAHYRGDTEIARQYREILKSKRDILYDSLNENDPFRTDFVRNLAPAEEYLRGKLGRRP